MIKRTLCFSNPAYLSLSNGQMVFRMPEVEKTNLSLTFKKEATRTFPVEDIGFLVLDDKQITITQGLLEALLENNCAVITCDKSHLPVGLMLPLCGNAVQNERFREQLQSSLPLQKQLWQQTVQYKIANQAAILYNYRGVETGNMIAWSKQVKSGDIDNFEGRAAVYYWRNVFPKIDGFIRGQEEESPNNLLNYGYAILRAIIARALVCSGLLPTLGIHHHNRYNAYCLADDIMEPYRPYVDEIIIKLTDEIGYPKEITKEWKQKLLQIPTIDVNINGERRPLMIAAGLTTSSLYKCFSGETRKIVYPTITYG